MDRIDVTAGAGRHPGRPRGRSGPTEAVAQVGHNDSIQSRSLLNFPISTAALTGASISSATLYLYEVYSSKCGSSFPMDVYAPSTTLTSGNASWNTWNGIDWGGAQSHIDTQTAYNSSCPNATGVAAAVHNAVTNAKTTQTFELLSADEGDLYNYKSSWPPAAPRGVGT